MPFKSEEQRRFMWAKHPEIARRWQMAYGAPKGGKGTTYQNNTPVGSAGQPTNIKKEVYERRRGAIARRMKKKDQEMGKK